MTPSKVLLSALLAIFLSACLGGAVVMAQNNCTNPMFANVPSIKNNLWSTPGSAPSGFNSICPNIQDGGQSCCGQESSNGFQNAFNSLRSGLKATSDLLVKHRNTYLQQRGQLTSIDLNQLYDSLKQHNPNLDRQTLINAFNNFLGAMDKFFNNFGGQYGQCLGGILKYMAGMYCSACDPHWGSIVSGAPPNLTLKLKTNTCSALQNSCRPMFGTLGELLVALAGYLQVVVGSDFDNINKDSICGHKKCDNFICENMVAGISFSMPTNISVGADTNALDVISITKMSVDNARRAVTKLVLLSSQESRSVSLLASDNDYTNDGYDAVNVGSNASPQVFDTSTSSFTQGLEGGTGSSPSSRSLSGGAIAGIVVGSVVFVAAVVVLVAFVVMRKRRSRVVVVKSQRVDSTPGFLGGQPVPEQPVPGQLPLAERDQQLKV